MPSETYGTTTFDHQDHQGKLLIRTSEGSSVAVPAQDVLMWAAAFARAQRISTLDRMPWQEVLGGGGG